MITVSLDGSAEVVAYLDDLDERMRQELKRSISRLSITLQTKVMEEKLSGQVLNVGETGNLKRTIHQAVESSGDRISGIVSTNLFYGIGWETGWVGAQSLQASKAKFDLSSSSDTFKNGTPKKRAFLVPALQEMDASGAIAAEINKAIARATAE